jgi:hypothetical protein
MHSWCGDASAIMKFSRVVVHAHGTDQMRERDFSYLREEQCPSLLPVMRTDILSPNGYRNREGLDWLVGAWGSINGSLKILALHKTYRIPLNLHLSGTPLKAVLWQRPDFFVALHKLVLERLLYCFLGWLSMAGIWSAALSQKRI